MNNLRVNLESRIDRHGKTFYLGKINPIPVVLNLRYGIAILVFNSEPGAEEMQLAPLDRDTNHLNRPHVKDGKISVGLTPRPDRDKNVFYVSKIKMEAEIDFSQGVSFLIFTSISGSECIQIVNGDHGGHHAMG